MLSKTSQDNILALKKSYQKLWWPIKWLFFPRNLGVALQGIHGDYITDVEGVTVCLAFPKDLWFFQRWITCLKTFLSSPLGYTVNALNQTKYRETRHSFHIVSSVLTEINEHFGLGNAIRILNEEALLDDDEHALDYLSAIVKEDSVSAAEVLISLKRHAVLKTAHDVHVYCERLKQKKPISNTFEEAISILAPAGLLQGPDAPNLVEMLLDQDHYAVAIATIIVRIKRILERTPGHPKGLSEYITLLKNHQNKHCLMKAFNHLGDLLASKDAPLILDAFMQDTGNPIYCAETLVLLHHAQLIPGPNSAECLATLAKRNTKYEYEDNTSDVAVLHQKSLLNLDNFKFILSFDGFQRCDATKILACLKDLGLINDGDTAPYLTFLKASHIKHDTPELITSLKFVPKHTAPVIIKAVVNSSRKWLVSRQYNQLHTMGVLNDTNTKFYADVFENGNFGNNNNYNELTTDLHAAGFLQGQFSAAHFRFVQTNSDPILAMQILRDLKSAHIDPNDPDVQASYEKLLLLTGYFDKEILLGISTLKNNQLLNKENFIHIMSSKNVKQTVDKIVSDANHVKAEVTSVLDTMITTIEKCSHDPRLFGATSNKQEDVNNNTNEIVLKDAKSLFSAYQQYRR